MKTKQQNFVFKSICTFMICVFLFSCKNDMKEIAAFKKNESIPLESAIEVEYLFSENAIIKTRMTAPRMNRFEKPEAFIELPEGLYVEMFDTLGVIKTSISANYARKYEAKQLIEAKYDVLVTDHADNKKLNTNHLVWDEANKRIFSDKFVKITTPDKIIFGDGFESDQNFTEFKIKKPKGEILLTRDDNDNE